VKKPQSNLGLLSFLCLRLKPQDGARLAIESHAKCLKG
jgi:hypothetical protein